MQRSLWLRRFAAVTVLALVTTACGGDDGDSTSTPTSTETTSETSSSTVTESDTASPTESDTAAAPTESATPNQANGTLELGYILPETGPLAFLGPPQIEAVKLAIEDINAAGGVLDQDVGLTAGDEAGDATIASQSAQRELANGVDAIVGAASSGMSLSFIDAVTGAGVAQCSASNTSPTFTDYNDDGLYFRTAPTDALQGPVLAQAMIDSGATNIALMARADDYGQGLLNATKGALEASGATVAAEIIYDPEAPNFDSEVQQAVNAGADATAVIAFDEGAQILKGLIEGGVAANTLFGADGLRSNDLASLVDPSNAAVLEGMQGTAPASQASEEFITRFKETTGLEDDTFAAQAYDCTVLLALGAVAADSDAGKDLAAEVVNVSREGTKCTTFQECKDLLAGGEDIDYDGASGSVDFTPDGEPESGTYEIWMIGADGAVSTVSTQEANLNS